MGGTTWHFAAHLLANFVYMRYGLVVITFKPSSTSNVKADGFFPRMADGS